MYFLNVLLEKSVIRLLWKIPVYIEFIKIAGIQSMINNDDNNNNNNNNNNNTNNTNNTVTFPPNAKITNLSLLSKY